VFKVIVLTERSCRKCYCFFCFRPLNSRSTNVHQLINRYGGDLVADSPAALHFFDMSSFYKKTIYDWLEAQWGNGAYTETSVWQDLNDYAGIGHGAGETVWASAPPVLTVRHYQSYGDKSLLERSLPHHVRWLDFLDNHFSAGMKKKGYNEDLSECKLPNSPSSSITFLSFISLPI
jgi:hypothetical protein